MKFLRRLGEYWNKLSSRERRLALIVLALAGMITCLMVVRRVHERILELDDSIMMLEDSLVESQYQVTRREAVEEEYRGVASQHSSAWSGAEILDRLRNEIYRLAHNIPSPLNANGVADQVENGSGLLVNLPELGEGVLNSNDKGFREYQISLKVSNVPITSFISYLERLQASPQSLRIDGLNMKRNVLDDRVTASIDLTRIIVDRVEATWTYFGQDVANWVNKGCQLENAVEPVAGGKVVHVKPAGPKGAAYVSVELDAGEVYELDVKATTKGKVSLRIFDEGTNSLLEGQAVLEPSSQLYDYRIRFTLPGDQGSKTSVRLPIVSLEAPDSEAYVSLLAYRKGS